MKDVRGYGNCNTVTVVDLLSDLETHVVTCNSVAETTSLSILERDGALAIGLGQDGVLHYAEDIPVIIRVDKGPLLQRKASWNEGGRVRIDDTDLALRLLHTLAHGQRAVIKIGEEGGVIQLTGSQRAIEDFRRRAGLNPQTLTLESPEAE